MKKILALVLAAVMILSLCACGAQTAEPETAPAEQPATEAPAEQPAASSIKRGGTIRVGKGIALSTLDPTKANARDSDFDVFCQIYDTLIKADNSGNLVEGLAESWNIVDDTTIDFKLREDVVFHDGTAFNAEAVKANFEYFMNPDNACIFASEFKCVESVEVIDEFNVEVKLSQPSSLFLTDLTNYAGIMIAPSALEKGADYLASHACGAGPFKVADYVEGVSLSLAANENYYVMGEDGQALPYVDGVEISMITDQTTKVNSIMAGDIDVTDYLNTTGIETLESSNDISLQRIATSDVYCLFCNVSDSVLSDINVRQAIAYAVDRDTIAQVITRGYGFASVWACDPGQWFYDETTPYTTNIDKAKELLAAAGYADGLTIEMSCISREPDNTVMQVLQQQLDQIGITLTLESMERTEWVSLWTQERTGQLGLAKMTVPRVDPYVELYTNMGAGANNNYSGYTGEKFNELIDSISTTYDTAEQTSILHEAQSVYLDDCATVFLYQMPRYDSYANYIQNFNTLALGPYNFATMWIDK